MFDKLNKRIAFGVLIFLSVLLAFATMYEKLYGTEEALKNIYHSIWFVLIWGILVVASLVYIFRRKLYRNHAGFMLHLALAIILLGALVSWFTSQRGYLHVRQGEITTEYFSIDEMEQTYSLPFEVKLLLFDVKYHPGTDEPADYISYLKVDEEVCKVSMNRIVKKKGYRIYQFSYDPDEMGTVLLVNHDPWGIGITYMGYLLLALAMSWLLWLRIGMKGMISIFIPTAGLWYYISQLNPMTPILRSPMLAAHVSVIMISYLLLTVILIFSIVGIIAIKKWDKLYRWNSLLLYPALFLLAAGIFIGAIWANISWGRYWGWDAKETWALITLLIYSLPLHKASLSMFRNPTKFHIYCIVASLTVIMTFFGVTYFLGGIHSYV